MATKMVSNGQIIGDAQATFIAFNYLRSEGKSQKERSLAAWFFQLFYFYWTRKVHSSVGVSICRWRTYAATGEFIYFLESRGMLATTRLFIFLSRAGCLPRQEWREVGQAIIRAQAKQQQGLCSG